MRISDKLKLCKLSRSCTKKPLERFFEIDSKSQSMVYFGKQTDKKPKKSVDLKNCIIRIEAFKDLSPEEVKSKETSWNEKPMPFRLAIVSSQRDNKPVYTYAATRQQAISIKLLI